MSTKLNQFDSESKQKVFDWAKLSQSTFLISRKLENLQSRFDAMADFDNLLPGVRYCHIENSRVAETLRTMVECTQELDSILPDWSSEVLRLTAQQIEEEEA